MNDTPRNTLEERSKELFVSSVDNVDMRIRSRLTQARTAALAATAPRHWFLRWTWLSPAAGVTAAAILGAALWLGTPLGNPWATHSALTADSPQGLEDLEMVASTDGSGDSLEMLQNDLDFYDFADKAAAPDTTA